MRLCTHFIQGRAFNAVPWCGLHRTKNLAAVTTGEDYGSVVRIAESPAEYPESISAVMSSGVERPDYCPSPSFFITP